MTSMIDLSLKYYAMELGVDEAQEVLVKGFYSQWVETVDGLGDRRRPALVKPDVYAKTWERRNQFFLVINKPDELRNFIESGLTLFVLISDVCVRDSMEWSLEPVMVTVDQNWATVSQSKEKQYARMLADQSHVLSPTEILSSIWGISELLRDSFKRSYYGRIILPLALVRRFEGVYDVNGSLKKFTRNDTWNELGAYLKSFPDTVRDVLNDFGLEDSLRQVERAGLLVSLLNRFGDINLDPAVISNHEIGHIFEELVRHFEKSAKEESGEHFTPKDIARLISALVVGDRKELNGKTVYDPTAGTGGFIWSCLEYAHDLTAGGELIPFGQEMNREAYAVCKAYLLIRGLDSNSITIGDTLVEDRFSGKSFDFMISHPPFGFNWKRQREKIELEHEAQGYDGRFGPGLPRSSDGSLLFLLHLVSKMKSPKEGGSRICIMLNSSALFAGNAGSGESEIRRFLFENDLVESIIALPTDMLYNTGIETYVWVLANNKMEVRKGKVQLIDATQRFSKMRKSLGSKRNSLSDETIQEILETTASFRDSKISRILTNAEFGYRQITINQPLKLRFDIDGKSIEKLRGLKSFKRFSSDLQQVILNSLRGMIGQNFMCRDKFLLALNMMLPETASLTGGQVKSICRELGEQDNRAEICCDDDEMQEAAPPLRITDNVPLEDDVIRYFDKEISPRKEGAWIDSSVCDPTDGKVGKVGYEIRLQNYFLPELKLENAKNLVPLKHIMSTTTKGAYANSQTGRLVRVRDLSEESLKPFLDSSILERTQAVTGNFTVVSKPCLLLSVMSQTLKPTYYTGDDGPLLLANTNMGAFSLDTSLVDIEYLINELNSEYAVKQLHAYQTGGSISRISVNDILQIKVELPSLEEQKAKIQGAKETQVRLKEREVLEIARIHGVQSQATEAFASFNHSLGGPLDHLDCTTELLTFAVERVGISNESLLASGSSRTVGQALSDLQDSIDYIVKLRDNFTDKLVMNDSPLTPVSLIDFLEEYLEGVKNRSKNYRIEMYASEDISSEKAFMANQTALRELVDNVVNNAERHAFTRSEVTSYELSFKVTISEEDVREFLCLDISDNGEGFPKNFDKSKLIRKNTFAGKTGNSGTGGYDIQNITLQFGGTFDLILEKGSTTYSFRFPLITEEANSG